MNQTVAASHEVYSHCFNSEMKVRMIFMHGIDPYADVNQTKMVLF